MIRVRPFYFLVRLTIILFSFLLLISSVQVYAQNTLISPNAVPFTRLYSPKEYQAGSINMAVKKDKKGILYFANIEGVLQFDGKNWRTINVPDVGFIRTLDVDESGTVFIGAINQFGKIEPDSTGKLEFNSLIDLLDSADRNFGEVWKVKSTLQGVFFSTDKYIFRYKNGKIKKWIPEGKSFYSIYSLNNEVYVLDKGIGLKKLENESLQLVSDDETIKDSGIYFILPYLKTNEVEVIIGRNHSSFLIYNPKTNLVRDFETELTKEEISTIYHGLLGEDGKYYISTLRHGIICINQEGKKIFQYKQSEGIADKIYASEMDSQNNLWLALSKGIAKIELGSPFTQHGESKGLTGIVTDITRYNDLLYVSSTNGVFYYDDKKTAFVATEGRAVQTWKMKQIPIAFSKDTLLFAATSIGLNKVKKKILERYLKTDASSSYIALSSVTPNKLYIGLVNQKGVYQLDILENDQKSFLQIIPDITTAGLETTNNLLFVLDRQKRVHIYKETDTLEKIKVDFSYDINHLEKHNEQIFITTDSLVYVWKNNNFEPYTTEINKLKKEEESFSEIFNIDDSTFVIRITSDETKFYLFNTKTNKSIKLPLERLTKNSITIYTFFGLNEENKIGVGTFEGLFYLDINSKNYEEANYNVFIRKIMLRDSVFFIENYTENNNNPILEYNQNSLTFFYSSSNFLDEQNTLFRYKLNGYDKKWSEWTTETKKEYTNLNAGKYSFEVEAKNIYNVKSEIVKYDFKIKPPYYKTSLAYVLYFVFGILVTSTLTYGGIRYNIRRLEAKNKKLEATVRERTSELQLANSELEQQKEEVLMQKQNIEEQKEEIEKSYQNIQTLAEMGQQITATLDLSQLISTLYSSINSLMPAEGFGIGIFNAFRQQIDFRGFIEKGKTLPFNSDSLEDTHKLAVQSFLNKKEIFTNNFEKDFPIYNKKELEAGELPKSLIYFPLVVQEKSIGVITVQSFIRDAYQNNHLAILRSLASYAAIAVSNVQSYAIINEKNQHITDSIRYARTIQAAILPSKELIEENTREFFILYRPKDIVSGDFYWFTSILNKDTSTKKTVIATIDCTGHGVPGAFMSLIGNTFLHEIINEKHITNPAQILENLDKMLKNSLQKGEQINKDGMDVAICTLEPSNNNKKMKLSFAGAKRPMWYALPNTSSLESVKGTRRSIGSSRTKGKEFENNELFLEKGTSVYLTTDGFADQSNSKGEKFGTHNLIQLLEKNLSLSMKEQHYKIEEALDTHQENVEQRDDITVIGFKIG